MKRQEMAKLREYKAAVNKLLPKMASRYKLKKLSNNLWTVKNELFFSEIFDVCFNENTGNFTLSCPEYIKPMWIDELLWNVMEMEGALKAPVSLRCNGAFAFHDGVKISRSRIITGMTLEEMEGELDKIAADYTEHTNVYQLKDFYEDMNRAEYNKELYELLLLIHKEEYEGAIEFAGNMKWEYFGKGNMSLPDYAAAFCRSKLK